MTETALPSSPHPRLALHLASSHPQAIAWQYPQQKQRLCSPAGKVLFWDFTNCLLQTSMPSQAPVIISETGHIESVYHAMAYSDKTTDILIWLFKQVSTWCPEWSPSSIFADKGGELGRGEGRPLTSTSITQLYLALCSDCRSARGHCACLLARLLCWPLHVRWSKAIPLIFNSANHLRYFHPWCRWHIVDACGRRKVPGMSTDEIKELGWKIMEAGSETLLKSLLEEMQEASKELHHYFMKEWYPVRHRCALSTC